MQSGYALQYKIGKNFQNRYYIISEPTCPGKGFMHWTLLDYNQFPFWQVFPTQSLNYKRKSTGILVALHFYRFVTGVKERTHNHNRAFFLTKHLLFRFRHVYFKSRIQSVQVYKAQDPFMISINDKHHVRGHFNEGEAKYD